MRIVPCRPTCDDAWIVLSPLFSNASVTIKMLPPLPELEQPDCMPRRAGLRKNFAAMGSFLPAC